MINWLEGTGQEIKDQCGLSSFCGHGLDLYKCKLCKGKPFRGRSRGF